MGDRIDYVEKGEIKERMTLVVKSYVFQVESSKEVWRAIKLSDEQTLDDLSQAILGAFDFDDEHLYGFFLDGKPWSEKGAFWSPRQEKEPSAGKFALKEMDFVPKKWFLYLYDFGDEWLFRVKLTKVLDEETLYPGIVGSEGEAPIQYPWDDDDEYDEDDE